jgi:hypothetical protein
VVCFACRGEKLAGRQGKISCSNRGAYRLCGGTGGVVRNGAVPKRERDVQTQYFRVEPGLICIDCCALGESATCCGVNLAGFTWEGSVVCFACRGEKLAGRQGKISCSNRGAYRLCGGTGGVVRNGAVPKRARDVQTQYFRVEPGLICIDCCALGESATCCGVNLARAGWRGRRSLWPSCGTPAVGSAERSVEGSG